MGYFCFQASPTQRLAKLSLALGEESPPILFKGVGPDDAVNSAFFVDDGALAFIDELGSTYTPENASRTLAITGARMGTGRIRAAVILRTERDRELATIDLDIHAIQESAADLTYSGKYLCWHRSLPRALSAGGPLLFDATSGLAGHQIAREQRSRDHGPLPEGLYSLVASIDPRQSSVDMANRRGDASISNAEEGIQFLRVGGQGPVDREWGTLRVRLTPISGTMYGRGGFYLHNSRKGYSHGCIEVGTAANGVDFFSALLTNAGESGHPSRLVLRVKYAYPEQTTRGRTAR